MAGYYIAGKTLDELLWAATRGIAATSAGYLLIKNGSNFV